MCMNVGKASAAVCFTPHTALVLLESYRIQVAVEPGIYFTNYLEHGFFYYGIFYSNIVTSNSALLVAEID